MCGRSESVFDMNLPVYVRTKVTNTILDYSHSCMSLYIREGNTVIIFTKYF